MSRGDATEPSPAGGDLPDDLFERVLQVADLPQTERDSATASLIERHPEHADALRRYLAAAEGIAIASALRVTIGTGAGSSPPRHPDTVGPYRILNVLGEGGMGIVYRAEQLTPVRDVALKLIRAGFDSAAFLRRFELERQVLAVMNHENIARVFDAGTAQNGLPYYALEYVPGPPITTYCDQARLSIEERVRLFLKVCAGVQHAHQRGVIHRDLTPRNVLVTESDGQPVPKIIDFGLARATDAAAVRHAIFSAADRIVGTWDYMSPEQADPGSVETDTRSDVYSLGALFYELLVGDVPLRVSTMRDAGVVDRQRAVRERMPARPSTRVTADGKANEIAAARRTTPVALARRLRADLDWIALKCLAKEPDRRYPTVEALATDLQRFLDHQPVLAGPPSATYRLRKFARRYRVQVAAAGVVLLAVVVGLIGVLWFAFDARASEATALARKAEFDQLAGVEYLKRALEEEKKLYPAWPENIAAMQRWLDEDVGRLMKMKPVIDKTIADLRARALPSTIQEIEHDRTSHSRFGDWQKQAAKLASLEHADAIRSGAELRPLLPTAEERAMTPSQLNAIAWPRVNSDESKRIWGEEARALMLAKLAWDKAKDLPEAARSEFGDTLAWAWFWSGKDEEARTQSEAALALAPADKKADYEGYLATVRARVAAAQGEAGAKALTDLRTAVATLGAEVTARRTFRFVDESQGFLHDTLSELLEKLASLDGKERKAVDERLSWARRSEALTLGHPNAPKTWKEARDAIAKADGVVASALYRGQTIDLRDQDVMGLVPIGMNPQTKLWEFYELRSAWDGVSDPASLAIPRHAVKGDDPGHIEVAADTGIVFVLLPGGKFTMGSQADDPDAPNYDPQRENDDEAMHSVTLSPFFLARHELTQGQWKRLSGGETPSHYAPGSSPGRGPRIMWSNPVENVDWDMCTGLLDRHGMVLPTEAQWEYGCRAGTTTAWLCALEDLVRYANVADATAKAAVPNWVCEEWTDGHIVHAAVGSFLPNALGLFDVHGNVWEWTRDGWHGARARPRAGDGLRGDPGSASTRTYRGGSFVNAAPYARSALRYSRLPTIRGDVQGLRPARALQLGD